jgi:hypothetical protein
MIANDEDASRWEAVRQLRRERPRWVIIWVAQIGKYRAYPPFRAWRGLVVTAATTDETAAQMDQIERACSQRARSPDRPSRR